MDIILIIVGILIGFISGYFFAKNNMNSNEIIANRANEILGGTKGNYSSKEWAESVKFWQEYSIKE